MGLGVGLTRVHLGGSELCRFEGARRGDPARGGPLRVDRHLVQPRRCAEAVEEEVVPCCCLLVGGREGCGVAQQRAEATHLVRVRVRVRARVRLGG